MCRGVRSNDTPERGAVGVRLSGLINCKVSVGMDVDACIVPSRQPAIRPIATAASSGLRRLTTGMTIRIKSEHCSSSQSAVPVHFTLNQ